MLGNYSIMLPLLTLGGRCLSVNFPKCNKEEDGAANINLNSNSMQGRMER